MMKLTIFLSLIMLTTGLLAQEVWSLERCVEHATSNSIAARQTHLQVQGAEINRRQATYQRIPSLNANSTYGFNFGRTIDPLTNTFENQTVRYNSYGVNGSALLYQAGRVNRQIAQADLALEAAKAEAMQNMNDLALQVSSLYLSTVLAEAQVEIARDRIAQSEAQLRDTETLIRAGALAPGSRFEVEALLARENQLLVQAENVAAIQMLNLKNLLELDPDREIVLERPGDDLLRSPEEIYMASAIFNDAVERHPGVMAARLQTESAMQGIEVAKRNMYPSLAVFGQLNTNYSNLGQKLDGFTVIPVQQTIRINGQPVTIETDQQFPNLVTNPFFNQLNENFGQGFGVQLSIPIVNGLQRRLSMQQAELNAVSAGLTEISRKQQLRTEVQQAVADVQAAWRNLEAAEKFELASEQAFNSVNSRYVLGAATVLELNTARSSFDAARIEKANAKYEYIFRLKVLDFYMGKDLRIQPGF